MFGSTSVVFVIVSSRQLVCTGITLLTCALCPLRIILDLTRLSDIMTTLPNYSLCTNPVFTEGNQRCNSWEYQNVMTRQYLFFDLQSFLLRSFACHPALKDHVKTLIRYSLQAKRPMQKQRTILEHDSRTQRTRANRHQHVSLSSWGVPYRKETWEYL